MYLGLCSRFYLFCIKLKVDKFFLQLQKSENKITLLQISGLKHSNSIVSRIYRVLYVSPKQYNKCIILKTQ